MNESIKLPFTTSHAFIIGINDYAHITPLKTAVNDAKGFAQRLEVQHGYTVHGPLLNPNKSELDQLFEETMPKVVGPEDRVVFYFAGHGIALDGEDGPNGYLVPADAKQGDRDTLIPMNELHKTLNDLSCNHGLLIMDCCFSGAFKWSTGYRDVVFDLPKVIYEERFWRYVKDPAWQVITSSAYDQKAVDVISNQSIGMREEGEGMHSPFAKALFEAIEGAGDVVPADQGDGVITASELYAYLRDSVESQTQEQSKRQSPSMFNLGRHDKGEFIFLSPKHRLNLPPIPDRNPFMGLSSYNEADSNFFFGRDRVIDALYEKVSQCPLTVVSGASGTGKSSVIKAGLLPKLRKEGWELLPVIRPGKEPMEVLQNELPDIEPLLREDKKLLLIVDQYEELISQTLKEEDREDFEAQLATWLGQHGNLRIILSVRSDFEPQFESKSLAPWWRAGRYIVPAFSMDEIEEVITQPALQAVLFYEPIELVDKLEEEVSQAPGALPLLSFTLSELYYAYLNSGRQDRALTLEDYEALGGVIGALRTKADEVYLDKDEAHQNSMRKLMLRMVSLEGGELASKRVYADELVFSDPAETQRIERVGSRLVEARLIRRGKDLQGRVFQEPAHDALVRAWGRLWEWIKTVGEEKLVWQNKLSQAVADYHELLEQGSPKAKNLLWNSNPRLDILQAELQEKSHSFNAQEEDFVRKSVIRKKTRQRQLIGSLVTALVIFAGLALFANTKRIEADKQSKIAQDSTRAAQEQRVIAQTQREIAEDSTLAAQSQRKIAEDKSEEADAQRRVAISQRDRAERRTREAQSLTLTSYARSLAPEDLETSLGILRTAYEHVGKNPPGQVLQVLASKFYDQLPGKKGYSLPIAHTEIPGNPDIRLADKSPDGSRILTISSQHSIKLWTPKGKLIKDLKGHTGGITSISFSPDGNMILSTSVEGLAKLWSKDGKFLFDLKGHKGKINRGIFSPNKKNILTTSTDKTAILWNKKGHKIATLAGHKGAITTGQFSATGDSIVTGSEDGTAMIWGKTGELLATLTGHEKEVYDVKFSPRGTTLLTTSKDNSIRLWNLKGEQKAILEYRSESSFDSSRYEISSPGDFSPDGNRIIGGFRVSGSGPAVIWDHTGAIIHELSGIDGRASTATFSPDGKYILTASDGEYGNVKLWKNNSMDFIYLWRGYGGNYAKFSPDGTSILIVPKIGEPEIKDLQGRRLTLFKSNLQGGQGFAYADFLPDGSGLIAHNGKDMKVWNSFGKHIVEFKTDIESIKAVNFSPDGEKILITDQFSQKASFWNLEGEKSADLPIPTDVSNLISSPDMNSFLEVNYNDSIRLIKPDGSLIAYLIGSEAQFSPNGQYILTFLPDNMMRLWSKEGRLLQNYPLPSPAESFNPVSFSADSKKALVALVEGNPYLLEQGVLRRIDLGDSEYVDPRISPDGQNVLVQDEDEFRIYDIKGKFRNRIKATYQTGYVTYSPTGKYILSSGWYDGRGYLWNKSGMLTSRFSFDGRSVGIKYAVFSPDENYVLIQTEKPDESRNGTSLGLWDLDGTKITEFQNLYAESYPVYSSFSPDGQYVLIVYSDGMIRMFPTPKRIYQYLAEESPYSSLSDLTGFGIK